jgi:hypothetical protein
MAGTVVVDTVKSSTSGAPVFQNTSGTQIGQLARAWVKFDGTNAFSPNPSTSAITASFNVASITKNGSGDYTVNFTNNMSSVNYCAVVFGGKGGVAFGLGIEATTAPTAAAYRFSMYGSSFTPTDTPNNCVAIFST